MSAILAYEEERYFIISFNVLGRYEDIEKIAHVLVLELGLKVFKKLDGPDARVWYLDCGGVEVLLINDDPYGSFLRAETASGKELLRELAPKLESLFVKFIDPQT